MIIMEHYIFFSSALTNVDLKLTAEELSKVKGISVHIIPARDLGNNTILYIESKLDEGFSADIWLEIDRSLADQAREILANHPNEWKEKTLDGMFTIVYNNEDMNVDETDSTIESSIKRLVNGIVYRPEDDTIA